jgi:hypothetical protein
MNGNFIKASMEIIIPPNVMNADILTLKAVFISFESVGGGGWGEHRFFNAVSAFKKKSNQICFIKKNGRMANVDTNTLS